MECTICNNDTKWCDHSVMDMKWGAAQAEIARLTAEVERLTDFIRHIGKVNGEMHGGMVAVAKSEIATAWNDAIEAAAVSVDNEYQTDRPWRAKGSMSITDTCATIRALKLT